jgi:hypothetical protein
MFFEMLLLKRLLRMAENNRLIPNHQFCFRQRHPTIKRKIKEALENKKILFCSIFTLQFGFRQRHSTIERTH